MPDQKFHSMNKLYVTILLLMLFFCGTVSAQSTFITVDGKQREFKSYIPANLGKNRPLLISCHGMNQDANYQKGMLNIESVADTAKFAVVFPEGEGKAWDIGGNKDINFVLAIIDYMVENYDINRYKVYLSGFSMGGMFTYHAMNRIPDKIAAFAPISGYPMGGTTAAASRPIPIIHTHGLADDVCVFGGVQGALNAWIKFNGCNTTATVTSPYIASHGTKRVWSGGKEGVEVVLIELEGKGHWISNDWGLHTGNEIWKFCNRYSLHDGTPQVSITVPATGSNIIMYGQPETFTQTITVDAFDYDGTIKNVDVYINDVLKKSFSKAPYTFQWQLDSLGSYKIKAVVTDDSGKQNTAVNSINFQNPQSRLTLSLGFKTEGTIPVGWTSYDGKNTLYAPQSKLTQGCRVIKFNSVFHAFETGFYLENLTGEENAGKLSYGDGISGSMIYFAPGYYNVEVLAANWNSKIPMYGKVCVNGGSKYKDIVAQAPLCTKVNLNGRTNYSFTKADTARLFFKIEQPGYYTVSVSAPSQRNSAIVVGKVTLEQTDDSFAEQKCVLCTALANACNALALCDKEIYQGDDYNQLLALFNRYCSLRLADRQDFENAVAQLVLYTRQVTAYVDAIKSTLVEKVVYSDNFKSGGANSIPGGWIVGDGNETFFGLKKSMPMNGCRVTYFSSKDAAFQYGLCIVNKTGGKNAGWAVYGHEDSDSILYLLPGHYRMTYQVANWKTAGDVTIMIRDGYDEMTIASQTVTPDLNFKGSNTMAFSNIEVREFEFDLPIEDYYVLRIQTAATANSDALIGNVVIYSSTFDLTHVDNCQDDSVGKTVFRSEYYSLDGVQKSEPVHGLNIRVDHYSDNSTDSYLFYSR